MEILVAQDFNMTDSEITSAEASAEAVHKAKNAAQAIEVARELQLAKAVEVTAQRTKQDMLEALKEVFGESDAKDPERMHVLVRRIPILCSSVLEMHSDIAEIKDNQKWATRAAVGALITILVGVVGAVIAIGFRLIA